MKRYITKIHYKEKIQGRDKILSIILKIASIPYFIGCELKNYLYKKNILKIYDTQSYVISVGNLTTGGTGKTPITAEIANYLQQNGDKVCIVSRGYKGKLKNKTPNIISNGEKIFYEASMAGDEPFWLAKNCPKVAIITCSDRKKGIKYGKEKLNCNKFILDDGFQHQRVKRDLNIVVIDGEKKFGNGLILPAGPLREPITEIHRADKIIIVNKDTNAKGLKGYKRILEKALKKPIFICNMKLDTPYNINTNEKIEYEKLYAFCAIGQPKQFFNLLKMNIIGEKAFADHHRYCEKDIEYLWAEAKSVGATGLITTEKDAVKLKELKISKKLKIFAVKLIPEIDIKEVIS